MVIQIKKRKLKPIKQNNSKLQIKKKEVTDEFQPHSLLIQKQSSNSYGGSYPYLNSITPKASIAQID